MRLQTCSLLLPSMILAMASCAAADDRSATDTAPTAQPTADSGAPAGQVPAGTAYRIEIEAVGLSMTLPEGWGPGGVSGESVLASYAEGGGLYPGFNATIEPSGGRSLEAVHTAWIELLSSATVHRVEERSVSGHPALFAEVSWFSILGALRAQRLLIALDDRVIVATFAGRDEDFTDDKASEYQRHLESITLER